MPFPVQADRQSFLRRTTCEAHKNYPSAFPCPFKPPRPAPGLCLRLTFFERKTQTPETLLSNYGYPRRHKNHL